MQITSPLLAATLKNELLPFPLYASPKLDGIRILKQNDKLISRSFKLIKNKHLNDVLTPLIPNGCDGEIFIKDANISDISSFINSIDKQIENQQHVQYFIFDFVTDNKNQGYLDRLQQLPKKQTFSINNFKISIIPLIPTKIISQIELTSYEETCLKQGYEGVMVRKGESKYKCGRSTIKECILVKIKRFIDTEATIIGFQELLHNENKIEINELNENFRSSKKEGKTKGNILGAFIVETTFNNKKVQFKIGTGFSKKQRQDFWNKQDLLLGQLVKFKYFEMGSKNVPRHPVFLCIRTD